jgi:hypothetical protein
MKVNTELEDFARQASWLGFLREARKVTLQSLAVAHATQRSNLSAFVTSQGKVRNISPDKIRAVLFDLGVLPDGMLSQGLHRWVAKKSTIPALCSMLALNQFERCLIFDLGSKFAFLVAKVVDGILIFAELEAEGENEWSEGLVGLLKEGLDGFAEKVSVIALDRIGRAQMQTLWMTKDDSVVQERLLSLMG